MGSKIIIVENIFDILIASILISQRPCLNFLSNYFLNYFLNNYELDDFQFATET